MGQSKIFDAKSPTKCVDAPDSRDQIACATYDDSASAESSSDHEEGGVPVVVHHRPPFHRARVTQHVSAWLSSTSAAFEAHEQKNAPAAMNDPSVISIVISYPRGEEEKARAIKTIIERAIIKDDLKKFSASCQIGAPVPSDLLPVLTNDRAKQGEIAERANRNAKMLAVATLGATNEGHLLPGAILGSVDSSDSESEVKLEKSNGFASAGGGTGACEDLSAETSSTSNGAGATSVLEKAEIEGPGATKPPPIESPTAGAFMVKRHADTRSSNHQGDGLTPRSRPYSMVFPAVANTEVDQKTSNFPLGISGAQKE